MSDSTNRSNSYLEKASPTVTKPPRNTKHFILTPSSTLASYTASDSRLLRRQLHLIQQRRGHETQRSGSAHGFSNGLTMIATAGTSHQTQRRNLQQKTSAIRTTQDNGLAVPQQQLQQRHNRTKSSQPSINNLVNSSILSENRAKSAHSPTEEKSATTSEAATAYPHHHRTAPTRQQTKSSRL